MTKNNVKALCSALLLSTLAVPAYAVTSANLAGPTFFNTADTPVRPRIYHAFDLGYNLTSAAPAFSGEDTTPLLSTSSGTTKLAKIAAKGYTHVLVSPPNVTIPSAIASTILPASAPTTVAPTNSWSNAYKPYICVLDSNYQADLNTAFKTLGIAETPYSKYGYTLSDGTVIGYRLGSDRYGSANDLATLIMNAKTNNLGVIVDVTLHQTGSQIGTPASGSTPGSTLPPTSGSSQPLYAVTYVPGNTPTYTLSSTDLTQVKPTTDSTATNLFTGSGSYSYNSTPTLNTSLPAVQTMIAGYLQLLKDMGVAGIRIYGLSSDDNVSCVLKSISQSSWAAPTFSFGFGEESSTLCTDQTTNAKVPGTDMVTFAPVLPLEDFALQSQLAKSFVPAAGGTSFGLSKPSIRPKGGTTDPTPPPNMSMPLALVGNTPAITFSVNPSMYPRVGTPATEGFYSGGTITSAATTQSQLATAYLCSIRNGSPMVLRYEDERDSKFIIQRALGFRTLMEQYNAPHEYISPLPYTTSTDTGSDVLLIARQYGFAIINNNTTGSYTIGSGSTSDISTLAMHNATAANPARNFTKSAIPTPDTVPLSYYIPAGTYQELSATALSGSTNAWNNFGISPKTYTVTWSNTGTTITPYGYNTMAVSPSFPTVNNGDARFFVLTSTDASKQTACSVMFKSNEFVTETTNKAVAVAVVGNHPLLGDWSVRPDLLNMMLPSGSAPAWSNSPSWSSVSLRFPSGLPLVYQNVLATGRGNGVNTFNDHGGMLLPGGWEYYGGNISNVDRLLVVPNPSNKVTNLPNGTTVSVPITTTTPAPDGAIITVTGDQATVTRQVTQATQIAVNYS